MIVNDYVSKFNQKIVEAQEAMLEVDGGNRIAAEGNRKYILQTDNAATGSRQAEPSLPATAAPPSACSTDSISSGYNPIFKEANEYVASNSYSSFFPSSPAMSPSQLSEQESHDIQDFSSTKNRPPISFPDRENDSHCSDYAYSQDPIPEPGEGESELENVEWESGLSADDSNGSKEEPSPITIDISVNIGTDTIIEKKSGDQFEANDLNNGDKCLSSIALDVDVKSSSRISPINNCEKVLKLELPPALSVAGLASSPKNSNVSESLAANRSILEHAVTTASQMNDWAAREMQKVLKTHLRVEGKNGALPSNDHGTNIISGVNQDTGMIFRLLLLLL